MLILVRLESYQMQLMALASLKLLLSILWRLREGSLQRPILFKLLSLMGENYAVKLTVTLEEKSKKPYMPNSIHDRNLSGGNSTIDAGCSNTFSILANSRKPTKESSSSLF